MACDKTFVISAERKVPVVAAQHPRTRQAFGVRGGIIHP